MSHTTSLNSPWFGADSRRPSNGLLNTGYRQSLRLLTVLRVWSPFGQAMTLFVITTHYGIQVPTQPIVAMLCLQVLLAIVTLLYLRRVRHVSALELMLQAHLDIAMFATMLYLTGGAANPFAPLFVLPTVVIASALQPRHVWTTVATTLLAYVFLRYQHVPLFHPEGTEQVFYLFENGMVINYMITAVLLAVFCNHMRRSLRRHERQLAAAREAQMRSESVLAIGSLAAGYAHELSSPLSTMAVVLAELQRGHGSPETLQQDLRVIEDQVDACKRIVSNLAAAAGRRRAESASAVAVDRFMASILEQVRSLHPGATIEMVLEPHAPPPRIVADETLRQAITNLLTNAVQASPCDVQFKVDWTASRLHVAVRDRGPGYSPDVMARLGQPMQSTRDREGGFGLGLGLALSMTTLERLGGHLTLSNRPEGGALAEMHLPLDAILLQDNGPGHEQPPR